jgi:nucleoside-diphosphate-sugar epimerase
MRDEITRMAQEAGLVRAGDKWVEPARWGVTEIVHFAALVGAAQREACAAMLDENAMACENPIYRSLLQANAQAIREMGQP